MVDQVTDSTFILLDVMEAELSDAGTYECRVVFTDNSTSDNINMGSLIVVGTTYVVWRVAPLYHISVYTEAITFVMGIDLHTPCHCTGRRGTSQIDNLCSNNPSITSYIPDHVLINVECNPHFPFLSAQI